MAESLLKDPKLTVGEVAKQVGIARSTLYTYLKRQELKDELRGSVPNGRDEASRDEGDSNDKGDRGERD